MLYGCHFSSFQWPQQSHSLDSRTPDTKALSPLEMSLTVPQAGTEAPPRSGDATSQIKDLLVSEST